MEYKDTFKNGQGIGLEIRIKAECPADESMREALSFIAQSSHRFYLDAAKAFKEDMEAAKASLEETASRRPDFAGEPNMELKEGAEDLLAMGQEEFNKMLQRWLKSVSRCKFAEGNGGCPAGGSLAAGGTEMPKEEAAKPQKHPCDILMGLSMKVPYILAEAAMGLLGCSAKSEYAEIAAGLLSDAWKYGSIDPYARGCDESLPDAAEALRDKRGEKA